MHGAGRGATAPAQWRYASATDARCKPAAPAKLSLALLMLRDARKAMIDDICLTHQAEKIQQIGHIVAIYKKREEGVV